MAETDPAAARSALRELRADHLRLSRLEAWLGGDPDRATFGLGAAIQLADTELASRARPRALGPSCCAGWKGTGSWRSLRARTKQFGGCREGVRGAHLSA